MPNNISKARWNSRCQTTNNDNDTMRTIPPLPRLLFLWLMLLALFMGALGWAKTASTANSFFAAETLNNIANCQISNHFTHIDAGTPINRGRIDGGLTHIDVGTLNNPGSGHIYGDHVAGNTTKGESAQVIRNFPGGAEPNLTINVGQQNKHVVGTNEYKTASQQAQRSPLADGVDPQALVNQYAGTGQAANKIPLGQPGSVERISTDKVIGNYIDDKGVLIGPTTNFTIRYAKDGVHIIPARP